MPLLAKIGKCFKLMMVLVVALLSSMAHAATDVSAIVDRNALNPDDSFTLTITISSDSSVDAGQPTLPPMGDFDILNQWTSQETRASLVSGPSGPKFQTVRSIKYNYMLQPKREGRLTLGAAEVTVDGKTFNTKPITLQVEPGAGGAQGSHQAGRGRGRPQQMPGGIQIPPGFMEDDEDDVFSQLLRRMQPPDEEPGQGQGQGSRERTLPVNPNEAFFVQVDADKKEAYVGEQITVSWYLYTRGGIRDLDTLKYPSLKGFWKEDIEIATQLNFSDEVVNGIPYKKALLASFALFPIKEGVSVVDSYTAKCTVIPVMDAFGGMFGSGRAYSYTKSSQPLKMTVKPLPTEGRPSDFSGAVGDFQVSARVEDTNVVTGQPFSFKIRFEGKGNAKLIDIPPFQPPEGMELYDTQKDAKYFRTGTSYKDFSILMIPRREGDFEIPPVSVSIFDPAQKRYITKTTEKIRLKVGKGAGGNATPSLTLGDSGGASSPTAKGSTEPGLLTEMKASAQLGPVPKAIGYTGLFILVGALLFWQARRELGWGEKKKDLVRKLRARLRRVDTALNKNDLRLAGVEMTNTVYFVLGEVSGEGGANVELDKLLLKAPPTVRHEIGEALTKQMETFHMLSFAPEGFLNSLGNEQQIKEAVTNMSKLLEKAVALGLSSSRSDEFAKGPKAF